MLMYEIIKKTKNKIKLNNEEIVFLVNNYTKGLIPDYQVSAWLMAVCLNALTVDETTDLTLAMRDTGYKMKFDFIDGVTVDKHSTGGVGDKTSLIIGPIVASCGVYVPKMSGKGLGHTGGTIDKLESIPGFKTELEFEDFKNILLKNKFSIISQSNDMVLADKKMYALRDVTATVDSIPLICSSIMSKKLAMGADCILLDVKMGSGAFMKNLEDAKVLAETMVKIGENAEKKCRAIITNMDFPLGKNIGNSLEVIECIEILKGNIKGELFDLSLEISTHMLNLSGKGSLLECREMAENSIKNGSALKCLEETIRLQGGDVNIINDYKLLPEASQKHEVYSLYNGFISKIDSEQIGLIALELGAGRKTKEDKIDYSAGIVLNKSIGDEVKKGELLATLHSSVVNNFDELSQKIQNIILIGKDNVKKNKTILEII
jgi:pyrimidine-nucleoside phosphorylase